MPSLVEAVFRPGELSSREQPRLRAGPVVLRPWADDDGPAVVAAYQEPDIQRWHSRSMTLAEARVDRGQGIAPQALLAATGWAFDRGFHRLELEHSTQNPASCRVALKAQFAGEGVRRGAALHADGRHDMHVHGRVSAAGQTRPTAGGDD